MVRGGNTGVGGILKQSFDVRIPAVHIVSLVGPQKYLAQKFRSPPLFG